MKQLMKPLSILLSILMVLSMFTLGTVAVSATEDTATDTPEGYITIFFTDKLLWGENLTFNFLKDGELLNQTDSMTFVETNEAGENIYKYSLDPATIKSFSFSNPSTKNKTSTIYAEDFKNGRGYYCDGDPQKTGPFSTYQLASYTYFEDPNETSVPTTTVSPTTAVPTTGAPTTSPAPDNSTYIVAGVSSLCGSNWNGNDTANSMTWNGSVYAKTYSMVAAGTGYQFKVVKDGSTWIGDSTGNNITFNVTSPCDVTITYNPTNSEITVTGTGVVLPTGLDISAMRTVGNGSGAWLNGVNWAPASDLNKMTETSTNIYTITYNDIPAGKDYQVKFASNGSWTDNWGGVFTASGEWTDAYYNDQRNITVATDFELADITLTLDLSAFNYSEKSGAKFKVDIVDATSVTTQPVETTAPVTTPTEPAVTDPTEPAVTDPTEPAVTDPTEPAVTDPTEPAVTDPTEPAVTTPTEPSVPSTPDEGTPDESTPDESTPDESTPDEYAIGDVDRDGKITVKDATLVQKYLADLATLDEEQLILAEVMGDGKLNIKDATQIQKIVALLVPAPDKGSLI